MTTNGKWNMAKKNKKIAAAMQIAKAVYLCARERPKVSIHCWVAVIGVEVAREGGPIGLEVKNEGSQAEFELEALFEGPAVVLVWAESV